LEHGVGTFYGDDTHAGQPVRVRFRFLWGDVGDQLDDGVHPHRVTG
jgi:hypothetical protein